MVFPSENRRWTYNKINPNTRTVINEFIFGVEEFVNYACQSSIYISERVFSVHV